MKNLGFIFLFLVFAGCERKGCTDKKAVNYDFNASRNNASCVYEGSIVFWISKTTASKLRAAGSNSLVIQFNGKQIAVLDVNNWSEGIPECGSVRSVTYTEEMGSDAARTYELKVLDQRGDLIYQAGTELKGGVCVQQELWY